MPTPRPPAGRDLPAPVDRPSPVLDPDAARRPPSLQLPPHQSKTERIADHMAALSQDLREWTELRIALLQRKVEGVVGIFERIQHLIPALEFYVPGAILGLVGLLFALLTLAFGLGALFGQLWLGFLVVTLLLLLGAGVFIVLGRRRQTEAEAIVAEAKRRDKSVRNVDIDDVREVERLHARQSAA